MTTRGDFGPSRARTQRRSPPLRHRPAAVAVAAAAAAVVVVAERNVRSRWHQQQASRLPSRRRTRTRRRGRRRSRRWSATRASVPESSAAACACSLPADWCRAA